MPDAAIIALVNNMAGQNEEQLAWSTRVGDAEDRSRLQSAIINRWIKSNPKEAAEAATLWLAPQQGAQ